MFSGYALIFLALLSFSIEYLSTSGTYYKAEFSEESSTASLPSPTQTSTRSNITSSTNCQELKWKWSLSGTYVDGDFQIDNSTVLNLSVYSYYSYYIYIEVFSEEFYDFITIPTDSNSLISTETTFFEMLYKRNISSVRAYQLKIYGSYYSYISVYSGSLCYKNLPNNVFYKFELMSTMNSSPYPSQTAISFGLGKHLLGNQCKSVDLKPKSNNWGPILYSMYGSFNLTAGSYFRAAFNGTRDPESYHGTVYFGIYFYGNPKNGYYDFVDSSYAPPNNTGVVSLDEMFERRGWQSIHADYIEVYTYQVLSTLELCSIDDSDVKFDVASDYLFEDNDECTVYRNITKSSSGVLAVYTEKLSVTKGMTLNAQYRDLSPYYGIYFEGKYSYTYCNWMGCSTSTGYQNIGYLYEKTLKDISMDVVLNKTGLAVVPVDVIYIYPHSYNEMTLTAVQICGGNHKSRIENSEITLSSAETIAASETVAEQINGVSRLESFWACVSVILSVM
eukprot:NODE_196_length_15381_cov_0.267243.p2 type:complete len:504 gc:universal NODE_196_length_15381_cov_0.267243:11892-10381(-)